MMRVGIYAGTFDPVHAGHIAFALQAMKIGKLDALYFLPERRPRSKQSVEHFGHRVAMLRRAVKPHRLFGVLELPDVNFSVQRTVPRLKKRFPKSELVFLFGSDVAPGIDSWPHSRQLLQGTDIIIGLRADTDKSTVQSAVSAWSTSPKQLYLIDSFAPHVSSGVIREALKRREYNVRGLLASVRRYSDHNWLYVSLTRIIDKP